MPFQEVDREQFENEGFRMEQPIPDLPQLEQANGLRHTAVPDVRYMHVEIRLQSLFLSSVLVKEDVALVAIHETSRDDINVQVYAET